MLNMGKAMIVKMALAVLLLPGGALLAQTTATGTINAVLVNKNALSIVFDANGGGVALGNDGSSSATLNFGNISAFGPLAAGVTRPSVTPATFTVSSLFNIKVVEGGTPGSPNCNLQANLSAAAPAGFTYGVDAVTLTTVAQIIQNPAPYNVDVQHALNLTVSTGVAAGARTVIINFTATSN